MRKLMAVCLAMLVALSMCSFTVMAEGEVDFSAIANGQPQNFVFANLVLGNHTITSSNTDVIALDGTVTRPLVKDATVQLTIDGGAAFDVTVKAQSVNALHYNDFSTATTEWTIGCPEGNTPSSIVDGKFHVIIGPTTVARTEVTTTLPTTIDYTKPVNISFDISNITFASSGADIRLVGGVYGADGTIVKAFPTSYFARLKAATGFMSSFWTGNTMDIDMKYDPLTGEFWLGDTPGKKTLQTFAGAEIPEGGCVKITGFKFTNAASNCTATFDMDNFVVYQEADMADLIKAASDEDKVAYFKGLVEGTTLANVTAVGQVLDLDAEYADYVLSEYGVAIEWASDNTTYIANNGTVNAITELAGAVQTVNMTATITAGSVSDTVVFPILITDDKTTLLGSANFSDQEGGCITHADTKSGESLKGFSNVSGGGKADRFVINADVKYTHNGAESSCGGIEVLTYASKRGIAVFLDYNTNKIILATTKATVNGAADGLTAAIYQLAYFDMPESVIEKGEGAWVHIMIDHNALSQTYSAYVDGVLINDVPLLLAVMNLNNNPGNSIRGYNLALRGEGQVWADNVSLSKYNDTDAVEVNAALNAALIDFGSEFVHPVLVNQTLPAMTIGTSWLSSTLGYNRDLDDAGKIKPTNVSTYTYVTDGPQITWTVDGVPATAINVASPKEVQLTITAAKGSITESKTVTRKVAPAAIRGLAIASNNLNGAWLEGATGNEKVVVVTYLENRKADQVQIFDLAELANKEINENNTKSYDPATGILRGVGVGHPSASEEITEVKIFVIGNGIAPVAFRNGMIG